MASRQFTDDFSAFHDHEHWPGYCLVVLRLCLLTLFLVGGNATIAAAESRDPDAAVFLKKLRAVGGAWLAAFPFLVCTAWCAPSNFRHRYVVGGLAVLQTTAILALAYLCLGSERFLARSPPWRRSARRRRAPSRGRAASPASSPWTSRRVTTFFQNTMFRNTRLLREEGARHRRTVLVMERRWVVIITTTSRVRVRRRGRTRRFPR